jgi:hypothetical protein
MKLSKIAVLGVFCLSILTGHLAAQGGKLVFTDEVKPSAPAQSVTSQIPPLPYVAHLPAAKTTGAPSWVKEGLRITQWAGDATVQGNPNMETLVPDANGNLVDGSGKRFRQSTVGTEGNAAGVGLVQLDVIYTGMGTAIVDVRNYLGDGKEQALVPQGPLRSENLNPGSNLYWVHPTLLAQCKPGDRGTFQILTGQWTLPNKRTFDVVIFSEKTASSRGHLVYDKASGVCLSMSNRSQGTGKHTALDPSSGRYGQATTLNTHISETYFMVTRQKDLPWVADGIPIGHFLPSSFHFAGPSTFEGAGGVGGPMTSFQIFENVKIEGYAIGAVLTSITRTYQGLQGAQPETRMRYHAANQIGGFYVSPKALQRLQRGQTVDLDTTTNVKTYVEFKGRADNGVEVVAITEQSPGGSSARWAYELSTGLLLGYAETTVTPDRMSASTHLLERQTR